MSFRLMQGGDLSRDEYETQEEAMAEAKELANGGAAVLVLEAVAWVKMAPTVTLLKTPTTPTAPVVVYRSHAGLVDSEAPEEAPRTPQVRPRLLVLKDRRATPAELVGHLMVVAEGKIVKNAYGGLTMDEMPLKDDEAELVQSALGQS